MTWIEDRAAISRALEDEQPDLQVRFSNGELWRDHHCLFHEDQHRSASWQEESGVYYCRTEDRRYPIPEVLAALALPGETATATAAPTQRDRPPQSRRRSRRVTVTGDRTDDVSPGSRGLAGQAQPTPKRPPDAVYEYYWPEGTLSHRKLRWGDGENKIMRQEGPDGEAQLPAQRWPLYGDFGAEAGWAWLVVEGEKACDAVLAASDSYRGHPVRALTAGSHSDLKRQARALAARLSELSPAAILVWPDNDEPGLGVVTSLAKALREVGLRFQVAKPGHYNLPRKAGVDDYLTLGGSLADAFAEHLGGDTYNGEISRLARLIPVTAGQMFVFPGTRRLARVSLDMMKPLWLNETGEMPTTKVAEELAAKLRRKAMQEPTQVCWRTVASPQAFWWRPQPQGLAYRVDAQGIALDDDPPGTVLALPGEHSTYSSQVEEGGDRKDLERMCGAFHLSGTEIAMIEGWLVSAFCGLQTPILLLRSPAATGKSTLARLILAVLEPVVPHLDVRERGTSDQRELVRTLERSPGVILDNVSRMSSEMEDMLSKLATGMTVAVRTLYEDSIEMLSMSRGIIVTTTNWDVFKGDLASRMVVAQPQTDSAAAWLSDQGVKFKFGPLVPRVRGHIFKQAVRFYDQRAAWLQKQIPFRIGDLGVVFASLGYDVDDLARREAVAKSEVIAINDPWLEALVALWKEEDAVSFLKSASEICDWLQDYGCQDVPHPSSPRLARWLGEKAPMFRDHGFMVEPVKRMAGFRGYRFYRNQPGQPALVGEEENA